MLSQSLAPDCVEIDNAAQRTIIVKSTFLWHAGKNCISLINLALHMSDLGMVPNDNDFDSLSLSLIIFAVQCSCLMLRSFIAVIIITDQ